ncbi:MAG TPA: polyhydroxyalkanoate synthesis repressor PhaR, partial [Gammaproteobacteria bacterium]|nr:polyhydroxyalkanoate synthesis repressor PhaR [Gammaproteobacteria bacterium]
IRIIKKYPNRRLYDTAISSYITQGDVKLLVLDNIPIQVIDARTKNDITQNTLLQIILEQEEKGPPIFTTEILQQLIRFYGGSLQNVISRTFEQIMHFFSEKQNMLKQGMTDELNDIVQKDPFSLIADRSKKNEESWTLMQQQWVQALTNPHSVTESNQRNETIIESQAQNSD